MSVCEEYSEEWEKWWGDHMQVIKYLGPKVRYKLFMLVVALKATGANPENADSILPFILK